MCQRRSHRGGDGNGMGVVQNRAHNTKHTNNTIKKIIYIHPSHWPEEPIRLLRLVTAKFSFPNLVPFHRLYIKHIEILGHEITE